MFPVHSLADGRSNVTMLAWHSGLKACKERRLGSIQAGRQGVGAATGWFGSVSWIVQLFCSPVSTS